MNYKLKLHAQIFLVGISFLLLENSCLAQTQPPELKFDSLVNANERYLKQDEHKLKMLNQLAYGYPNVNPAKGIETGLQAIDLAQKLNDELLLAEAYNNKGSNHQIKGQYPEAIDLFEKALAINTKINNQYGAATNNYNIGNICYRKGENVKAIGYLEKALNKYEELKAKHGIARTNNLLGNIYKISNNEKALEYYQNSLAVNEKLGDKMAIAGNLLNIGVVYEKVSDFPKSLEYYQKSLKLFDQLGNKLNMAIVMGNMGGVYGELSNYPKALDSYQKSLNLNEQLGDKFGVARDLANIGSVYSSLGETSKALNYFQKALAMEEQIGNNSGMSNSLSNIGTIYNGLSESSKALEYFQKALKMDEQAGNENGMALNNSNIGLAYANLSNYPKALENSQKALNLYEKLGNNGSMSTIMGDIGNFYRDAPDEVLLRKGIKPSKRYTKVLEIQQKSLAISIEIGSIDKQKKAWENLRTTYEKQGDFIKAFYAYKKYIDLRDSAQLQEVKRQISRKQMQYEFDKKSTEIIYQQQLTEEQLQKQVLVSKQQEQALSLQQQALVISNKEKDLQRLAYLKEKAEKQEKQQQLNLSEKEMQLQATKLDVLGKEKDLQQTQLEFSLSEIKSKSVQRNLFIAGTILMLLLAGSIFLGLKRTRKEKMKSDALLLNILPEETANELKETGSAVAKSYHNVTVIFTDFVNFTGISETMSPTELVAEIHKYFTAFDAIIESNGLEKIKTIGDAYLAVCGLPVETKDHAHKVTKAAKEICDYMQSIQGNFQIRIGLNSGPVVAGIVGVKKFAYDIWGDTVNTASRIESNSEAGRINISGATYELIKNDFACTHRGKISAKNKGEIDMYFVD